MADPTAPPEFDPHAWHDHAVWGIRFRGGSEGFDDWISELELDFDSILDVRREGERVEYCVAPARLVFTDVTDLRVNIDLRGYDHGEPVNPPMILVIERSAVERGFGGPYFAWTIRFDVGAKGEITFGASGFRETEVAKPTLLVDRWYFYAAERARLLGE